MIRLKNILNEDDDKKAKEARLKAKKQKVLNAKNSVYKIAKKIDSIGLGAPAATFLTRIAAVESCYGLNTKAGNNVWQVDSIAFEDTKNTSSHPGLTKKFNIITSSSISIDWPSITYERVKSSKLLNCLAARLYLGNLPGALPNRLQDQALYWKNNYNTSAGAGGYDDFISKNKDSGIMGCIDYAT